MTSLVLPAFRRSAFRRPPRSLQAPWGPGMPGTHYVLRGDKYDLCLQDTSPATTGRASLKRKRARRQRGGIYPGARANNPSPAHMAEIRRALQPTSHQTTTSGLQSLGQQTLGTTGPERKPGPVERAPQVHPHPPERSNGRRRGAHCPAERRASLGDEEEEGQGLIEKKVYKRVQRERRAVLPTYVSSIEAQHHASSSRSATRRAGPLRSAIGHVLPGTHCHRPGKQRDRRTLAGTGGRSKGQWQTAHPTGQLAHDRTTQSSAALHLCSSPAASTKRTRSGQENEKSSTAYAKGRHRTLSPGLHGPCGHASPTAVSRPTTTTTLENEKKRI